VNRADLVLTALWCGLTFYTLLGGADFGAGIWYVLPGGGSSRPARRDLLTHTIGPVWEANHVWLILVITLFWTAFPPAFAAFAATLYVPLTLAAVGVIGRGAAFAFRNAIETGWQHRAYGAVFGISSVLTPYFLGTIAGAVASGRVPPEVGAGDPIASWANPTSVYCGLLAVVSCAYLAAAYLTADAVRAGVPDLAELFRRRALASGVGGGLLALAGLAALCADAPTLVHRLTHHTPVMVGLSVVAGLASIVLLTARWYVAARITAGLTVAALLWGWGLSQYPVLLYPDLTVDRASAVPAVLDAILVILAVSAVLLFPALGWLLLLFQRRQRLGT
jgi:cytochrome d ubiquinol oxidase subunit II